VSEKGLLRHRLADELRERIVQGEVQPGDRLPSEPALARELGVSRASLRAAITVLEEDGFVRRRHGSGTYVSLRPVLENDLGRNFGVTRMIAATGLVPGTVDEWAGLEPASEVVAEALEIEPGQPVSTLRRVRTAGGRRVVDSVDWCRTKDLPPEELQREAERSLYTALAARGLAVHHGVAQITPDVADVAIARRLDVPRGALLLTLFQVDATGDGRPVLASIEHHLADAFDVTVYRRGPGTGDEG
jgi:DNA-binding GntR family transcriptional regulator